MKRNNILYQYTNGSTFVTIKEDGTKIREYDERFPPSVEFPESIDIKITNYCDLNCPFCHENSNKLGKHADLDLLFDKLKDLPNGVELACLSGESVVYSENGMVEIKDLKIGDYIYDSNHNLVEVKNIQTSTKKVVNIKGNKGFNVNCSKDHPFMSDGKQIKVENLLNKKIDLLTPQKCVYDYDNIQFDLSKYVTIADPNKRSSRSGVIKDNVIKLNSSSPFIPRYVNVDKELMWMYGLAVAEGSKKSIALNINEVDYANRFIKKYKDIFGLDSAIYINEHKNSQTIEPKIPKAFNSLFFKEMEIGYGARNKSLSFLFKIKNKEYIREAFSGLFDGDGAYRKRNVGNNHSFNLTYKTSSKKIVYEMSYLLKKHFDVDSTVHHGINKERKIEDRILKPTDYYQLEIYNKRDIIKLFPDLFKDDCDFNNVGNLKYSSTGGIKNDSIVKEIKELNITENLYDITLSEESTHIFPINGYFLTHNCGGGNPLSHPDLIPFLEKCKSKGWISNITVNQKHLTEYDELLTELVVRDLIKGVGISVSKTFEGVELKWKSYEHTVLHLIAGVHEYKIIETLVKIGFNKFLILGYKQFGRGINYYDKDSKKIEQNLKEWKMYIPKYLNSCVLSFDNLSIEQLEIKRFFDKTQWDSFYMGDDFTHSMYIDAVKEEYAPTSRSDDRKAFTETTLHNFFKKHDKNKDYFSISRMR